MKFSLEPTHKTELKKIVKSGMSPVIIVQRAKILLLKDDGKSGESIAEELGINRHTVDLWVKNTVRENLKTALWKSSAFLKAEGVKMKSPAKPKHGS